MTNRGSSGPSSARCLCIDLRSGDLRAEMCQGWSSQYLGGRGLGVRLVAEFGDPTLPALDEKQPFVLAAGPLTGTSAPSSGRFAAVAPSPLTGTIFDGNAGGRFGVRLRGAGVDALVLTGRATEWSLVVVERVGRDADRAVVSVVPVSEIWPECDPEGVELTASQLTTGLRTRLGPAFSFLFPGVAGRRGALVSSIRTDDRRHFGRGGLGAALAAKRVLAVAVAGGVARRPVDPGAYGFLTYEARKLMEANPLLTRALPAFGTAVLMELVNRAGALPVRNFQASQWDEASLVSGETLSERFVKGRGGCFGCRVRCTGWLGSERGRVEAPEYESVWALGPDCGIADLDVIVQANRLCGEYGLDTISAGATVACAMELSEHGVLGRTITFGDGPRLLDLLGQMGRVEGFGAELARGSARLAEEWGHPDVAMHVKRLELPAYDPRGMAGQGLGYATSNRGACHLRGNMLGPEILGVPKLVDRFATKGKSGLLINLQHVAALFDSVGLCKFMGFGFGEEVVGRLLEAMLGEEIRSQDALQIGERVWNLERLWNLAAGFTRADDTLPSRLLQEPVAHGPAAGRVVELAPMLDEYYRARGWDGDGCPSMDKVDSLGLSEIAGKLAAARARSVGSGLERPDEAGGPAAPRPGKRGRRHLRAV